jgi:hypothetical protein
MVDAMEPRCLLSSDAGAMVTGLYRQILLRDPGAQELARFSDMMDQGASVRGIAARLYGSAEFHNESVASYYGDFLGRDPTTKELGRWSGLLAAGASTMRVEATIAGSREAFARFDGDHQAFVGSLFVTMVGRQAEPNELAPLVRRLDAGASPVGIASMITTTEEYRLGKVDEAFRAVLDRTPGPDEARSLAARWAETGGLRGLSMRILSSPENGSRLRSGAVQAPDLPTIDALRQILLAPYTEASDGFVQTYNRLLGTNPAVDADGNPIASPPANSALWALTKAGILDGRPLDEVRPISQLSVPLSELTPLQSEIDLDKSLGFALSTSPDSSSLIEFLDGGDIEPFGGPIITGGLGEFIVDGHHRWSSIYAINPDARIASVDIGHEELPQSYLKVTQMAIGAELGYLRVQSVEGQNLFTISRPDFDAWVATTIEGGEDPQAVLDVFQEKRGLSGVPAVADFLWGNVERLRANNQPAPGVTSRDYMPQPPDEGMESLILWFQGGMLNTRLPVVARLS